MNLLRGLNAPQKKAVQHFKGPLLILAGAGSGKTRVMSHRIAYLLTHHKIKPSHVLGLSFTNKAAKELKERVVKLSQKSLGKKPRQLIITTFHSLCVRILRKYASEIGFDPKFTIMDQNDQLETIRKILRHIKIDDRKFDAFSILSQISHAKNLGLEGEKADQYFHSLTEKQYPTDYTIALISTYPRYQQQLKSMNAMDFDDLIFYTLKLLRENQTIRSQLNKKFEYILVDEYQDTNASQFELLSLLTQKQQNLCVVGDDDQSIYAWRGADPAHILSFTKHYPKAKIITLDQNYRSTPNILTAANHVIIKNPVRHPKKLWSAKPEGLPINSIIADDDHDEAETVAEEILKRAQEVKNAQKKILKPWKDFAILFRSNPPSSIPTRKTTGNSSPLAE